ncbi:MAG: ATP-binding protein [Steroidobacteraceae bacterium]
MRIGIKHKLAAAILAASVAATVAIGVATQFGFRTSFLDYLNEQGMARLESLAPRVAGLYDRASGWGNLRQHSKAWFEVVGIPGGPGPETPSNFPAGDASFVLAPNIDVTGTALRIALTDADGLFLIGYPSFPRDAPHRAVVVDGRTVGWLYLAPLTQVGTIAERHFQQRQARLTWIIGGIAVAAAALIALLLSHAFVTPIQAIATTARQLAAGRLGARVPIASSDEIGQLATDVNQLAQALERTESTRRNLMADISHEFRTPLAVLRAELEAMEDGVRTLSRESLHSLLVEVATLNKLVGDVHDLAIADLGALSYRRASVNVGEILRTCAVAFQVRFEQRGLRAAIDIAADDLMVFADEGRLQQLFNNLLENSVRHTDPGGHVTVSARRADGDALLTIEDSAPGVPDEVLPRLFERFFRVDASRSRATGGSGLGMAICRGIVEAHAGRIRAMPSPLGGLRIEISLPLALAAEPAA